MKLGKTDKELLCRASINGYALNPSYCGDRIHASHRKLKRLGLVEQVNKKFVLTEKGRGEI